MDLIERAKNIILQPSHEWEVIEGETVQIAELYKRYIMPLAGIGPIASLIFFSFVDITIPYEGVYYVPLAFSITQAILSYVLILLGGYIVALVVDVTAPGFDGQRSFIQAFKVSTYSFTPVWLAGICHLISGVRHYFDNFLLLRFLSFISWFARFDEKLTSKNGLLYGCGSGCCFCSLVYCFCGRCFGKTIGR